jgi:hypothetical protein
MEDIGLVKQYYAWFVIGSQCLVLFVIAIYWMVQSYAQILERSKQRLRRNSKGSMRFQMWFVHFLRSTPMLIIREICIVLFNFTIDNSYLVSLAGLYVVGLTEVTVLNAGYSKLVVLHLLTYCSVVLYCLYHF